MKHVLIIATALIIFSGGYGLNVRTAAASVSVSGDTITIDGPIGPETFDDFKNSLTDKVRRLRIRSGGGDPDAAIAIGEIVVRRDLEVVALDYCFSACAHFIFLMGSPGRLEQHTVVGLHHTFSSLFQAANGKYGEHFGSTLQKYKLVSQKEIDLYRTKGIDTDVLYRAMGRIDIVCVFIGDAPDGIRSINTLSIGHFWMPSADYLRAAGVKLAGEWPTAIHEFVSSMNRLPEQLRTMNYAFGEPPTELKNSLDHVKNHIPVCTEAQLRSVLK